MKMSSDFWFNKFWRFSVTYFCKRTNQLARAFVWCNIIIIAMAVKKLHCVEDFFPYFNMEKSLLPYCIRNFTSIISPLENKRLEVMKTHIGKKSAYFLRPPKKSWVKGSYRVAGKVSHFWTLAQYKYVRSLVSVEW